MNIVAIVGRPNVGKSTLFNRIVGKRKAIVDPTSGVTRDRIYDHAEWNGKSFYIIDTGGIVIGTEDKIQKAILEQAKIAMDEANVVLYVCDARDGVTPFDIDIAEMLRQSNKPVILVVNKCDNHIQDNLAYEFYSLGLGDPFPISALNGRNTGDFLDAIALSFTKNEIKQQDKRLKISIVGKPNVGKSSIVNALLGQNRNIVTDIPGTTRDSIDSILKYYNEEIIIIDTAGLRRQSRIKENLEMYSILRTSKAISRCDVSVVVLDASQGLENQDKKIIDQVAEEKKGIIIVVNKWDLIEKDSKTADEYTKAIYSLLKTHSYAPVIYTSALTKQRLTKIISTAKEIQKRRTLRISTSKLNKTMLPFLEKTPPPSVQGKDLRINYITQVGTEPPVFAFFCNHPKLIPDSYKRFIENTLRRQFDLVGTAVSLVFRRKNIPWEEIQKE